MKQSIARLCDMRAESVAAGVDWVTATTPADSMGEIRYGVAGSWLTTNAPYWCADMSEWAGVAAVVRDFKGVRWPHAFLGQNSTHVLCTVSSAPAHIACEGIFNDRGWRPSRLDLQVTFKLRELLPPGWALALRDQTLAGRDRREGRAPSYTVYDGQDQGETLYVGAPSSDKRLVIYDKGAEQRSSVRELIRVELRLKRQLANEYLDALRETPVPYRSRAIAQWVRAQVEFMPGIADCVWNEVVDTLPPFVQADRPSDERRLMWLQEQVRPTVGRLLTTYGRDVILCALGLDIAEVAAESVC